MVWTKPKSTQYLPHLANSYSLQLPHTRACIAARGESGGFLTQVPGPAKTSRFQRLSPNVYGGLKGRAHTLAHSAANGVCDKSAANPHHFLWIFQHRSCSADPQRVEKNQLW